MQILAQAIGFGIVSATLLVFGAGGFSLQYGLTNVFNFAFGSIMIASAFVAYAAQQHGLGFFPALILSTLFGGLFSVAINSFVYRPFARRGAGLFGLACVSFALATVVQYVLALIFGVSYVSLNFSSGHTYHLGSMVFTGLQLAFAAFAVVFFAALQALLRFTRLGAAIRAVAASPLLARACGIHVRRVVDLTWLLSGGMCGIGGFLLAIELGSFSFTSAQTLFPVVLAAAMVGGIGSASGAARGALAVGIVTEVIAAYSDPSLKQVYAFGLLGLVLVARRQGILRGLSEQTVVT